MPVSPNLIAAGVGLGVLTFGAISLVGAVRKQPESGGSLPPGVPTDSRGLGELQRLMSTIGMPADWQTFTAAVAHHESHWHSNAHNDTPSEKQASQVAYDRNESRLLNCPWAESRYVIGSGGWLGILPGNGVAAFFDTSLRCIDPFSIFQPVPNLAMGVGYARRLRGWSNFKSNPTWINLNRGWAAPTLMGFNVVTGTDDRFRRALDALRAQGWRIPSGWENRTVINLPVPSPFEIMQQFQSVAVRLPGQEFTLADTISFPHPVLRPEVEDPFAVSPVTD